MTEDSKKKSIIKKFARSIIKNVSKAKNYEKNIQDRLAKATIIVAQILRSANYSKDQIREMPMDERLSAAISITLEQITHIKNSPE